MNPSIQWAATEGRESTFSQHNDNKCHLYHPCFRIIFAQATPCVFVSKSGILFLNFSIFFLLSTYCKKIPTTLSVLVVCILIAILLFDSIYYALIGTMCLLAEAESSFPLYDSLWGWQTTPHLSKILLLIWSNEKVYLKQKYTLLQTWMTVSLMKAIRKFLQSAALTGFILTWHMNYEVK